jgi:anti-anti-sigma regulatory factor
MDAEGLDRNDVPGFSLPAVVTVDGIAEIRDAVLALLGTAAEVTLDCAAVEHADMSLIQVLLAAQRSADRDGRSLRIVAPEAGTVATMMHRAGLGVVLAAWGN